MKFKALSISLIVLFVNTACTSNPKTNQCESVQKIPSMGSIFEIQLVHLCSKPPTEEFFSGLQRELWRLESELSLYQKNSAIVQLNSKGKVKNVSPHFIHLVMISQDYYRQTDGRFNITIQSAIANPSVKNLSLLDPGLIKVGMDEIHFTLKGMQITLDGIAKGYAVDFISDKLTQAEYTDYLINFSGNMRWSGNNSKGWPWQVLAWDRPSKGLKPVDTTKYKAISTSGNEHQSGHIINPLTLEPINNKNPISVLGQSATECDALSTAEFVREEL
jgi:thiamine biosynthesis lipoprotein